MMVRAGPAEIERETFRRLAFYTRCIDAKDWDGLCDVFAEAGSGKDARQLARQVILLLDGAFAVVLLHRDPSYMEAAGEAAARLVRNDKES